MSPPSPIPAERRNTMPASSARIMVVDDASSNVRLLALHLEDAGYVVICAADGLQALTRAASCAPDLILLDVMMPQMDGYETCRRLKQMHETRDTPVIFMSALTETGSKLMGFNAGGVDYLTKPLEMDEVLARVRTHLTLRTLQLQLVNQNRQLEQQIAVRGEIEQALQDAHDNLEERVRQRTRELANATASLQSENVSRMAAEQRASYMAHYDALTGLPNRVFFMDRVRQALSLSSRSRTKTAVMVLDLDYFKHVNDWLGHEAGDRLLQAVAARLQGCLRQADSVARLGGDEFVVCLPMLQQSEDAALVAQTLLQALNQLFMVDEHEVHISATIGVALYPDDGADAEVLMRAADTAVYHAKDRGRSGFQFFTGALNKACQRRLALTNRLRRALSHDELVVHYQPQVDLESGRILACEALLRHQYGGRRKAISCGPLMQVAEETGLIVPIGEWVLGQACGQLRRWHELGFKDMRMAVNLSPRQFNQPDFEALVARMLESHQLPAQSLELEITENMLLDRSAENLAALHRLNALGVQLSIDDFGTGYSSLSYLQKLPIQSVKIDRTFVDAIGRDGNGTALVSAIIAMAASLKMQVLAEGVESQEQADFLLAQGCPSAQGWLYSRAIAADDLTTLLQQQRETSASGK